MISEKIKNKDWWKLLVGILLAWSIAAACVNPAAASETGTEGQNGETGIMADAQSGVSSQNDSTAAPGTSLKLNQKTITMVKGKTYTLKAATVNITGKLTWKSSKTSVAAVNSKGKVTAQGKGTATITVKAGGKKASCKVKVIAPALNKTYLSLQKGKSCTLKLSGTTREITWSSSSPEVASVDSTGKVRAKAEGNTTIKAKIGVSTLKCRVTVTETKWQKLLDEYRDDPETNQLLFIKYTGGSSAEAVMYNKSGTKWKKILSCSAEVGRNGIDKVMEGDKKTPTGTFNLTSAYGIGEDPGAKMDYVKVNSNLYWCGDPSYYNQLIDITKQPHNCNGEHLIEYTQCYEYGMFLDYNKDCVYRKGSAIFLHCKGNSGYTAGCIAVSRSDMITILRSAEPGARICIYYK